VNGAERGLVFDLSTPELIREAASILVEVYTPDGARRLAMAVLAILDPASPAALAGRSLPLPIEAATFTAL